MAAAGHSSGLQDAQTVEAHQVPAVYRMRRRGDRRGCSRGFSALMRACMCPLHQRLRCLKMAPSSGASPVC